MTTENGSEKCVFKVQPSKMVYIAFAHGLTLVVLAHILLGIISGPNSIHLIPFLLVTITVLTFFGIGVFVQIKYTRYTVNQDSLRIRVGLRKEVVIEWKDIEEIRHVPFKPFYKHQFKFYVKKNTESKRVGLNLSFIDIQNFKRVILDATPEGGYVGTFFRNYSV